MTFKNDFCRHYTGMMNKSCDAGVEYNSIKSIEDTYPPVTWHCYNPNAVVKCPLYEEHTPEELEEQKKQIAAALVRMAGFWGGDSDECPQCGGTIEAAEQVGRCVYARPCGCRVGQGKLPAKWKK